ncbi:hypothetical protein [Streptomyces rubellomurinus]|uniref:PknH-like extracellular domain-containing protein n=1 Tax=Streptomyces rubellomurinus (strain ATCC 31215) TaxID=359131 RepID=A0A0F2TJW8_STRR3|nr:hypothetical protein [Streptomyces rubellomurinus]KJS62570.1 hypothetical protein VM95_08220 [Streptomyces rubellomurinus]
MPLRRVRPSAVVLLLFPLLSCGCATVGGSPSADRAAPGRELSASELRAAAVADNDLGPGYAVTVMTAGHGDTGAGAGREAADVPACQPLLDVVAPGASVGTAPGTASTSPGVDRPYAETDLSVARAADPKGGVYGGLIGYRAGRAAVLQGELEQLFGPCASFGSAAPAPPAEKPGKKAPIRTRHRLNREDTPTPEGADAAIGFTLTNESGGAVLTQRAVLARVGTALAVFTTFGVAAEPAAVPDERIVRQQVAKLRAAQAAKG